MKQLIQKITRSALFTAHYHMYEKRYRRVMKINGIADKAVDGEDEWQDKWSLFGQAPCTSQYRVFSHYIGSCINIVPENICHDYIETVLNPMRFAGFYSDKNIFDKLFPAGYFPKTLLRNIGGMYYTHDYKPIVTLTDDCLNNLLCKSENNKIIIKPSVDGISGRGVQKFNYMNEGGWQEATTNVCLTVDYIKKSWSNGNFIIQEAVEQNEYISQFNPSSVNTLRLSLYRSVKDDVCHITGAIMRIGGKGSVVDNAHAGGCFVGIDKNGTFKHDVFDQYGRRHTSFNDIDFSADFNYPNWNQVIEFAKSVGKYVPHHRLLALDIVLDKNGTPHLIEFNVFGYSVWLYQYTTGPAFGKYTDEILDYCKKQKERIEYLVHI